MIASPSKVPSYTTKLTTLEVATMPELLWWSRVPWRHGKSIPKIMIVPDLG